MLLLVGAALLPSALAEESPAYTLALGERTESFGFPPLLSISGETWVAFEVLTRIDSYQEKPSGDAVQKIVVLPQEEATDADASDEEDGAAAESGKEPSEDELESMANEAVEIKLVRPLELPRISLPFAFTLGGNNYRLQKKDDAVRLTDSEGNRLGSDAMVEARRIYLAEDTLRELGLRLSYAPQTSRFRLVGSILPLRYDVGKKTLVFATLLPTWAYAEPAGDGTFRVVLMSSFAEASHERMVDPEGNTRLAVANLPGDRLEMRFSQQVPTGYKLYTEPEASTFFRLHFANHFSLVEYRETASGEIAVDIEFSRATSVKTSFIPGPPRLVLDFEGTIYDEATKRIAVDIGRVREIRVGQFQQQPPTVRVVVELEQKLNYRVLREGDGERYFVQFYRGEIKGSTVLLDAGHGGSDTGAIGVNGTYEKNLAIAITQSVRSKLERMGYHVYLTRGGDNFISLGERADYANRLLPAIFVSIHANWIEKPDYTGIMTFHYAGSIPGQTLAAMIQRHALSTTGCVDRGVRTANFFLLRETVVPAVLIETGFISNAAEELKLRDPTYQSQVAQGIANGIDEYFRTIGGF